MSPSGVAGLGKGSPLPSSRALPGDIWRSNAARDETSTDPTAVLAGCSIPSERSSSCDFLQEQPNMEHLVFTIIAPDQPGLVERIARCVAEHGGNWLESRMARMAGQFAGILRVAVPAESHEELLEALQALNQHGIRVLAEPCGPEPACTWRPVQLELVGDDRPGILYDITRVLTELGVNIEKLETEVDAAPMSNEMLFRAHA